MQFGRHCILVALACILVVPGDGWGQEESVPVELSAEGEAALADWERHTKEAMALYNLGRFEEAAELLWRIVEIFENTLGPDHPDVARALYNLGGLYSDMADYERALPLYERSLAIREKSLGSDHIDVATTMKNMGLVYSYMGDYDRALPLLEGSLAIREKSQGPGHPDVAESLNKLGFLYYRLGDFDRALSLYERALAIWEKSLGPEHPDAATCLNNLAGLYSKMGDYDRALPIYERILAILEKSLGPDHPNVAKTMNNMGLAYSYIGDYGRALPLYERSLAILEKFLRPDHPILATMLDNMGNLFFDLGEYDRVLPLYERSLALREKSLGPDHPDVASSLNNLGLLHFEMGDYDRALPLYERSLAINENSLGPDHPDVSLQLHNLGSLYSEMGDYDRAIRFCERALAINENSLGPDHPDVAHALNNLGALYSDIGDYDRALPLYERSLAIREKSLGPDHPDVATSLNGLGALYSDMGDYDRALLLYERSLAKREKFLGPNHPDVARTMVNLGILYSIMDDYDRALPLFEGSLAIYEESLGPKHPNVASTLNRLATLHRVMHDYEHAITLHLRATEIEEQGISRLVVMGSESQKRAFIDTLWESTNFAVSLHQQFISNDRIAAKLAFQTTLRRKGRVLDAQAGLYRQIRQDLDPNGLAILDQLMALRTLQANAFNTGPGYDGPDVYRSQLEQLRTEIDKIEGNLARVSTAFEAVRTPITIEAVAQQLPDDAALLEITQYDPWQAEDDEDLPSHYAAYLLKADGQLAWADLGLTEAIDKDINHLRVAISAGNGAAPYPRELASSLYNKLITPFAADLSDTTHLLIAPDGLLNLLPFEALVSPSERYLLEEVQLTYLGSGRDLIRMELKQGHRSPSLVIANPDYNLDGVDVVDSGRSEQVVVRGVSMQDLKWNSLPGTAAEAKAIQALLKGSDLLTTSAATESALKSVAAPEILHVATHGLFAESDGLKPEEYDDPLLRSALVMAGANKGGTGEDDGYLTASEAMGLDLFGTKLVVLSACETGVGEIRNGQGVYGLRRALVLAGSESQVMSLWAVGDEGTQVLMTDYYKRLRKKEGRSAALRSAKLSMITSESFSHPFYWAAFVPSGDWRNLQGKDRKVKGATGLSQ